MRRVVSIVRSAPSALRAGQPALEANAYAVAEDVDLTVVLRGAAVELALRAPEAPPRDVAGVTMPASAGGQDLRGLVESGVGILVAAEDLAAQGLRPDELVAGVDAVDDERLQAVLRAAEGLLVW
jgi:intracellular sulfur oxidation DsrE/DsrF family protein